ncbi:MAG: hypothetical protein ABSD48_13435 [Armatimonadota bacterium]
MSLHRASEAREPEHDGAPARRPSGALCARWLPALLALIPFASVVMLIAQYRVDVPYWDQWNLVPTLQKSYRGSLTPTDLWAQHNEHRILFPKAIMLLLAHASGWNITYELVLNVLLAAGIFAVLVWQVKRSRMLAGDGGANWLLPAVSLVVFSPSQWENWLWGWQICVFLNVLAVTGGIVILAADRPRRWRLPSALLIGVVASYSFASGLAYWLIAFPALLGGPLRSRQAKLRESVVWLLVGGATIASYLYHYHTPSEHPRVGLSPGAWYGDAKYALVYLGRPVSEFHALRAGALGVAALLTIAFLLRRSLGPGRQRVLLPYLCFSLYAVVSAGMTAVGRTGFGIMQALSPRYITVSNLLWLSILVLLYLLLRSERQRAREHGPALLARRYGVVAGIVAFALVISCVVYASLEAVPPSAAEYQKRATARAVLLSPDCDEVPGSICAAEDRKLLLDMLKRNYLSVFRESRDPRLRARSSTH